MASTNSAIDMRGKVYRDNLVWLATLIGGPLAGGYLIAENFRTMGDKNGWKKTWICTFPATFVMLGVLVFFWNKTDLARSYFFAAYSVLTTFLVRRYQSEKIHEHISSGGKTHPFWLIVVIGLAGLFVSLLLVKAGLYVSKLN